MSSPMFARSCAGLTTALMALLFAAPAMAHPHVWVDVRAEIVYDDGRIVALKNVWTFDEGYSQMAVEGLDKNADGNYDREELSELAQVNIDGLKEFDYFTHVKLADTRLPLSAPRDYWLERDKNGILTLHFVMPLAEPVLSDAPGFQFQIYDASYYIAFNLAKPDPIKLSAAPSGCSAQVSLPADEAEDAKKLGEAFFQQFGGDVGIGLAETVSVSCPAS